MDHKIYFPTRVDFGVYNTRRYPKGYGPQTLPIGPTQPTDPNSNPLTVQRHYSVTLVPPHAQTERWNYTVPPRRRAVIQSAIAKMLRDVAAPGNLGYGARIHLRRANGQVDVFIAHCIDTNNAVGAQTSMIHTGPIEMFEGDTVFATTFDPNAGGSVVYTVTLTAIEYDNVHPTVGSDVYGVTGAEGLPGSPPSLFTLKKPTVSGSGSGGVVVRSETALNPAEWQSIGGGYYQRI